jgi:riboflavin kinase/FMN adenylyltransferase
MQHLYKLNELQLDDSAIAIGSFDGVHLGHQALIKQMVAVARRDQIPSVVLTFYPHPSVVLQGRLPPIYITTPEQRALRLGQLGVDFVVTMTFDRTLSLMGAAEFIHWVKDRLQFRGLWVGENFALGHKREGNVAYLESLGDQQDFKVHVVPPMTVNGEIISSTGVREALKEGDVVRVNRYLGQAFSIEGVVVRGAGRGKQLNTPTANLEIWEELVCPGSGVYACLANVGGDTFHAVSNIGVRPTFDATSEKPHIEAHLLDHEGDLYGQKMELVFINRLRDEQRFDSAEALQAQIRQDIERARGIFRRYEGG